MERLKSLHRRKRSTELFGRPPAGLIDQIFAFVQSHGSEPTGM